MSRPKRNRIKLRIKKAINEIISSPTAKKMPRELVRMAKLYSVDLNKYHFDRNKKF